MRSRLKAAPTSARRPAFLILSSLALTLATASCATPASNVDREADEPSLEVPARAREACTVTATPVELLSDLETRDRNRGIDVRECDGKRALAVQTIDEEHRLEAEHRRLREARNRTWFERLTPWRED